MIKTQLTREDALAILELGKRLHSESRFKDEPFDEGRCWHLLQSTLAAPSNYFIAYDSDFRGFVLMNCSPHFFSGVPIASDYCLYIAPEHRGGMLVVRLLAAAQEWAVSIGAKDITIYHNTGIDADKAPELFKKLGFDMVGYIFTKELNDVRID